MIVGNGLIASGFKEDYENDEHFLIFAAGVSNSFETDSNEFEREEDLLIKTLLENKEKHLIYFSSFIDKSESKKKYANHKLKIESIIKKSKNYYTILKLPQAVGHGGNQNTLVNFIVNKLKNNERINAYKNVYKSLIDVADIKGIVDVLVKKWHDKNTYVEFPYVEKLSALEIVHIISNRLNITPNIELIEHEVNDLPELSLVGKIILKHLNIEPNGYTERVIKKYVK